MCNIMICSRALLVKLKKVKILMTIYLKGLSFYCINFLSLLFDCRRIGGCH